MNSPSIAPVSGANTGIGLQDHAAINKAANIPVVASTPVVAVSPIVLPAPGRAVDLQMRVSAPTTGRDLPVILLSHGHGASNNLSSFRDISFAGMTTPTLVVAGDDDISPHLTVRGADWHADPYFLSNGPKCLLTLFGAGHGLGGIAGYDAAETTDESPERVAAVARLTWAYLRTALYPEDLAWSVACAALGENPIRWEGSNANDRWGIIGGHDNYCTITIAQ